MFRIIYSSSLASFGPNVVWFEDGWELRIDIVSKCRSLQYFTNSRLKELRDLHIDVKCSLTEKLRKAPEEHRAKTNIQY